MLTVSDGSELLSQLYDRVIERLLLNGNIKQILKPSYNNVPMAQLIHIALQALVTVFNCLKVHKCFTRCLSIFIMRYINAVTLFDL